MCVCLSKEDRGPITFAYHVSHAMAGIDSRSFGTKTRSRSNILTMGIHWVFAQSKPTVKSGSSDIVLVASAQG